MFIIKYWEGFTMIKKLIRIISDFILWALLNKFKLVSFKHFRMGLEIARKAANMTKTTNDNRAVEFVLRSFNDAAIGLTDEEKSKLANEVDKEGGLLKDLSLGYDMDNKRVKAGIGNFGVEYDPSNGGVSFYKAF